MCFCGRMFMLLFFQLSFTWLPIIVYSTRMHHTARLWLCTLFNFSDFTLMEKSLSIQSWYCYEFSLIVQIISLVDKFLSNGFVNIKLKVLTIQLFSSFLGRQNHKNEFQNLIFIISFSVVYFSDIFGQKRFEKLPRARFIIAKSNNKNKLKN